MASNLLAMASNLLASLSYIVVVMPGATFVASCHVNHSPRIGVFARELLPPDQRPACKWRSAARRAAPPRGGSEAQRWPGLGAEPRAASNGGPIGGASGSIRKIRVVQTQRPAVPGRSSGDDTSWDDPNTSSPGLLDCRVSRSGVVDWRSVGRQSYGNAMECLGKGSSVLELSTIGRNAGRWFGASNTSIFHPVHVPPMCFPPKKSI